VPDWLLVNVIGQFTWSVDGNASKQLSNRTAQSTDSANLSIVRNIYTTAVAPQTTIITTYIHIYHMLCDQSDNTPHQTAIFTYSYDISTYSVKISLHLSNRCGPVRYIVRPLCDQDI